MSDHMLPPHAWLRGRPWGRDLALIVRGEENRIPPIAARYLQYGIKAMDSSVTDGLVDYHTIEQLARERGGGEAFRFKLDEDAGKRFICARHYEYSVAHSISDYLYEGSHAYSVGPSLLASIQAADRRFLCSDVKLPHKCIYIGFEGAVGETADGRPLDGFMLLEVPDGIDVLGLSRTLPEVGEVLTPWPEIVLPLGNPELSIADALRIGADEVVAIQADTANQAPPTADEEDEDGKAFNAAHAEIDPLHNKLAIAGMERIKRQAENWERLIGGALSAIADDSVPRRRRFQVEAPQDLASRAESRGTGFRKAEQKLAAAGYVKLTRLDPSEVQVSTNTEADVREETEAVSASEPVPLSKVERRRDEPKIDKRKKNRLERTKAAPKPSTEALPEKPDPIQATAEADVMATDPEEERLPERARHDADLLADIDEVIRRSQRDLPAIGSRNWEATFAPALAALVMRRARVEQAPRESSEAARKRLSGDIMPRFEGIEAHLSKLRTEQERNQDKRRAFRIQKPSPPREIDETAIGDLSHPIHILVDDDADLLPRLLFAGVGSDPKHGERRSTIIRAWRDDRRLLLDGLVFEGCLIGFRRIEVDLDYGDILSFDAEADESDPETLRNLLYAPVADVLLGPIDEADAWMYAPRRNTRKKRPAKVVDKLIPVVAAAAKKPDADRPAETLITTTEDFSEWSRISAPLPRAPLAGGGAARVEALMGGNAVTRALLSAVEATVFASEVSILAPDIDASLQPVTAAIGRHLASLAVASDPRLDALQSPDIEEDADLTDKSGCDGILIVTDRAVFEHASPGLLPGRGVMRERPVVILYRIQADGIAAMLVQVNAEGEITFAEWTRTDLVQRDGEDELAWYVRGAIAAALTPAKKADAEAAAFKTLPGMVKPGHALTSRRQGPRRIIAQVRMRPENVAAAIGVVSAWFDDQATRHGDRLVEDRRDDGEWTLEHRSEDRGVVSNWAVTVRMPHDHPGAIDVIVRTTLATGVKPRLPTLVRDIAAITPTYGPDGRFDLHPRSIKRRSDLLELIRHLQSPERVLPTLLMSQDRDGLYMKPPHEVAKQSLGALNVRAISDSMTYDLAEALGQEYRTFGGAVRIFQPRFDPDADPAARHPRIMNDVGADRQIAELISRATAATVTRYDIPDVFRPVTAPSAPTPVPAPAQAVPATPLPEPESAPMEPPAPEPAPPPADEPFLPLEPEEAPAPEGKPEGEEAPSGTEKVVEPEEPVAEAAAVVEETTPAPQAPEAPTVPVDDIDRRIDAVLTARIDALGLPSIVAQMGEMLGQMGNLASGIAAAGSAPSGDVLAAREAEIAQLKEELRAEREAMTQLLDEAESDRAAAHAQVTTLRQALNDRRREAAKGTGQHDWPSDLSGLSDWLDRNVLPNVVIVSKAWREMRRVRYTDMERLCRTLQLLDGAYIDMRAGEEGARQRWEEGLKELRLEAKPQSKEGIGVRPSDYQFRHEGQLWTMDRHIRGTESLYNDTERLLRIYFTFDKEERRILIGHMPTHLTTIDS